MSIEQFGYKQELKRTLSARDLLIFGMISMVPIAPFGVFGPVWDGAKGMVPLAYLIGMIAMFFTAMSYWSMSRAFPVSGSVYTYAQRGIHETVGFFAGWLILLDYILVPALLYIVSSAALAAVIPGVPSWVWVIVFIVINTILNILGVEMAAKANRYIVFAELAILAIFVALGLYTLYANGGHGLTLRPFYDPNAFSLSFVFSAVSIAVLSFLGFDAISTMTEECKDGVDSVGRATMWSLLIVGILFILQTWIACELAVGIKFSNLDNAFYDTAAVAGGDPLRQITLWATILSWGIANALSAQMATSRILYAMARDRKLPSFLATIHPRFKTPYMSTMLVAVISVIAGVYFDGHIADLSRLVNFGALMGFLLLHLSVINHFVIRNGSKDWLKHLLFPAIGMLIIGYVIVEMEWEAKQLGLIWLSIGVVYYLLLTQVFKQKAVLNDL